MMTALEKVARDMAIARMAAEGWLYDDIAFALDVSRRTVFRALSGQKVSLPSDGRMWENGDGTATTV